MNLPQKFRETAWSVLPVMGMVLALGLFAVPAGAGEPWWLGRFLAGGALLVLGLTLFLIGVDVGIQPLGERCGAALTRRRSLALLLGAAFVVGLVVTAAEPDIQVFGDQVRGVFPAVRKGALTLAIACGVGLFLSLGMLRTTLGVPLKAVLAASYAALFLLSVFAPRAFVGIAFDSGGATTGPMTVPFILALGLGVAAVRAREDAEGGFGLTGIASVGPVAAVLVYAILNANVASSGSSAGGAGERSEPEGVSPAEGAEFFESHAESAEGAEELARSIRSRLRRIVVDSVDWRNADVGDVIHDLRDFVLAGESIAPSGLGGIGFSVFLGDIEDWDHKDLFRPGSYGSRAHIPPFTIHATDIRLDALLDLIEKETGFAWRIEHGLVLLARDKSVLGLGRTSESGDPFADSGEGQADSIASATADAPAGEEEETVIRVPGTAPRHGNAASEATREEARIRMVVEEVVLDTVDFEDAPLSEVLAFFEASTQGAVGEAGAPIPFSFDEKAWLGGVPDDDDLPRLTLRSKSVSLANMLALVADVAGVRWRIVDGGVRCIPRVFEDGVSLVADPHPMPRPHAAATPEPIQHSAFSIQHSSFFSSFATAFPEALREAATSILPLFGLFLVFQFALLRMTARQALRIAIGFAWAFLGLSIFLTGVNGGFMQAGRILGAALGGAAAGGGLGPWALLIGTGLAFGAIIVCAEPAVWVLSEQVERASGGAIRRRTLLVFLSLGTALAIGLAMWRAVAGFPLWRLLLPGYALALLLLARAPTLFAGIAFDSGGVASGPLTSTFVLSFTLGAASAGGGGSDSFGVIALVAMMPLAAIQLMGILVDRARRRGASAGGPPAPRPAAPNPAVKGETP